MQTERFVNLNKAATYIQDAKGRTIMVRPFQETLSDTTRRPDAVYVLEGTHWKRFAQGGKAGPLHPFPSPGIYGRETLPPVQVHYFDGRADDGRVRTDGSSMDTVAVQPLPGKLRVAGDVLTPQGKIRRRNPNTGVDEEVDDTPENRNVLKPVNEPGIQTSDQPLKMSIIDYMERMGVETVEQFDALTDVQLIAIPGMNPLALPRLRENIRGYMIRQAEAAGKVIKAPEVSPAPKAKPTPPPPASFKTPANIKRVDGMAKGRGEPCALAVRYRKGRKPELKFCRVASLTKKYPDFELVYRSDEVAEEDERDSPQSVAKAKERYAPSKPAGNKPKSKK